jgi:YfiR/HmsC-like
MLNYSISLVHAAVRTCKIVPVLLVFFLAVLGSNRFALADILEEYTVKAALSLNFARFTEWPSNGLGSSAPTVTICTLGDNVVHEAFSGVEKKTIGQKSISVINLTRIRDLKECQLLFVSGLEKNKTIQLIDEISTHPILTIGEDADFIKSGGMVILRIVDGKVSMQINLDAVKKARLQINSRVLKLATIVSP